MMAGHGGGPPVLGIDLGGTKILAGVVDAEHRILGRSKCSTPARQGGAALLAALVGCAEHALAEAGLAREELAGVGVGSPGPLDPGEGVILFSANLNVRDYPLRAELSRALGRPVLVENDVRVGGYGELRLGAGRGYRDVLVAFVGTGIGGCLVRDGRLLAGSTGNAGELGHIVVKAGGPRCGCGRRGCLEALASKTAIVRRVAKAMQRGVPTALAGRIDLKAGRLKSKDLAAAVATKDPVAVRELRRAAHFLGLGLGSLINVIGPEVVIVGGGVVEALGERFVEPTRISAREQALADPEGRIPIVPAALGDDAGILGAALLARERFVAARPEAHAFGA